MKKTLLSISIVSIGLLFGSCGNTDSSAQTKSEKVKDVDIAFEEDDVEDEKTTPEWLNDTIIKENILFSNTITLKDGQSNGAGVSFVLKEGGKDYLVSANHLIGPDGGFKELVPYADLKTSLESWELSCFNTEKEFKSIGLSDKMNNYDAIYLTPDTAIVGYSKILKKVTRKPQIGEACYLIGFDPFSFKNEIRRIDFTYIQDIEAEGLLAFAYLSKHMLMGNSGGPIVNKYGEVIGILRGAGRATEEMESKGIAVAIVQGI